MGRQSPCRQLQDLLDEHAQDGNALGRVVVARLTFVELSNSTGVTSQVELDALRARSSRSPQVPSPM